MTTATPAAPPAPEVAWAGAVAACPKHMTHGPCAGVGPAGACEVPEVGECAFLGVPGEAWPYRGGEGTATVRSVDQDPFGVGPLRRPVVLADLPVAQVSSQALLSAADALRDGADALLLGDHGGARLQFPPSYRARLLTDAGLPAWPGINCRDRNRVAIEAELAACADAGVRGVHCVTGDHPALGDRPDAQPVFDCDSVDVARLAAAYGLAVSVAHAPTAPPVGQRVPRLLAKAVAGANVAVVDHCGGPDAVATAVAELRTAGFAGAVLVCVPVVFDAGGAVVLQSFAAGRLPVGYLERIVDAPDPAAAGAREAVRLAAELLAIPGVDGVNLSGGALGPDTEVPTAHRLAEVGRAIQALLPGPDHSVRPHPEVTAR